MALAIVTLMMGCSAMIAMENPILARIGGTYAGFAITTLVRLVLQFPVGLASDRYGRKRVIVWRLVANAPIVALMGVASSLLEFTLHRGIQGIALAGVRPRGGHPRRGPRGPADGRGECVLQGEIRRRALLAGGLAFLGFAVPFVVAGVVTVLDASGVRLAVEEPSASSVALSPVRAVLWRRRRPAAA